MTNRRISFIDFAKGYAIITIVLFHLLQKLNLSPIMMSAIEFGGSGVHLFFMLSGFGLLIAKKRSPLEFYKRRFSKVYLPYFLVLTICLLTNFLIPIYPDDGIEAYLAGVFLYQMFFGEFMEAFGGHFWFISAIIQFYIMFPLLSYIHEKIGNKKLMIGATLVSAVYWSFLYYYGYAEFRNWAGSCFQFLWVFALGMVLADKYKKDGLKFWDVGNLPLVFISVFGVSLAAIFVVYMGYEGRVLNDIPAFFGYTSICILFYKLSNQLPSIIKSSIEVVGDYSYSIYLVHALVISLALYILEAAEIDRNFWIIMTFVPIILLASWIYEKISFVFTSYIQKLLAVR